MYTLPVIKDKLFYEMTPLIPTCEYDPASGSFMPYALVRAAEITGIGLVLDMTAFVTTPEAEGGDTFLDSDDLLAVSLCAGADSPVLTFACNAKDRCLMLKDGNPVSDHDCERRSGEDERGEYWSVTITLSPEELKEHFGLCSLSGLDHVLLNAFKAKIAHPHRHFGAVAPFRNSYEISSRENLAEFRVLPM